MEDWPEMKKESVNSSVSWQSKEESMSGEELGTLSNAAGRLKKRKT